MPYFVWLFAAYSKQSTVYLTAHGVSLSKKSIFLISRAISLSLCERSVAHLPDALWAFTFRHPCLPSPSEKGGSKAELLKISRKADRDAPCDQARMLDSVRTEVLYDAKPTNERRLALGLRPKPHLFFQRGFSTVWTAPVFKGLFLSSWISAFYVL